MIGDADGIHRQGQGSLGGRGLSHPEVDASRGPRSRGPRRARPRREQRGSAAASPRRSAARARVAASRSREVLERLAAEIGDGRAFAADTATSTGSRGARRRGRGGARAGRDPRPQTGGPPRGALEDPRGVGGGLPLARPRAPGADRALLPGMRERGWGRIVNVALELDPRADPGLTLSNANRMAAVGLLNTLAGEVAADGITVNTIATGRFATDGSPQLSARSRRPSEAAGGGPGRPARHARGVRRPRRLRLLRAGRLPDGHGDPARRRAHPLG